MSSPRAFFVPSAALNQGRFGLMARPSRLSHTWVTPAATHWDTNQSGSSPCWVPLTWTLMLVGACAGAGAGAGVGAGWYWGSAVGNTCCTCCIATSVMWFGATGAGCVTTGLPLMLAKRLSRTISKATAQSAVANSIVVGFTDDASSAAIFAATWVIMDSSLFKVFSLGLLGDEKGGGRGLQTAI